jgi:hypothetical protein
MQGFCFYPFSASAPIWGYAGLLLLPFFCFRTHLGQCKASAFTLFLLLHPFGVMQSLCFYPFSPSASIWGNAEPLLLPFFTLRIHLGNAGLLLLPFFTFLIDLRQCRILINKKQSTNSALLSWLSSMKLIGT